MRATSWSNCPGANDGGALRSWRTVNHVTKVLARFQHTRDEMSPRIQIHVVVVDQFSSTVTCQLSPSRSEGASYRPEKKHNQPAFKPAGQSGGQLEIGPQLHRR